MTTEEPETELALPRLGMGGFTPTGSGASFVHVSRVSLEELLRRYDAAYPLHTELSRAEVIGFYRQAVREYQMENGGGHE